MLQFLIRLLLGVASSFKPWERLKDSMLQFLIRHASVPHPAPPRGRFILQAMGARED